MSFIFYWYLIGAAASVVLAMLEDQDITVKDVMQLAAFSLLGPIWFVICACVIADDKWDKIVVRKRRK